MGGDCKYSQDDKYMTSSQRGIDALRLQVGAITCAMIKHYTYLFVQTATYSEHQSFGVNQNGCKSSGHSIVEMSYT